MIVIFNSQGKKLKSIPNNDEFFNHVSAGELLEDHPEYDQANTRWSFIIFPPEKVPELYFNMKREFLTPPIKEAFGHVLGLIEICQRNYEHPTWVPITPGLDIGKLKKDWYLDFCKRHGYVIEKDCDLTGSET